MEPGVDKQQNTPPDDVIVTKRIGRGLLAKLLLTTSSQWNVDNCHMPETPLYAIAACAMRAFVIRE